MKIRNGFVSNSSSSSFVISKKINDYIFKNYGDECIFDRYDDNNSYNKYMIMSSIFSKVEDFMSLSEEDKIEKLRRAAESYLYDIFYDEGFLLLDKDNEHGIKLTAQEIDLLKKNEGKDNYYEVENSIITSNADKLVSKWKDENLILVSYSDNEGNFESFMEHTFLASLPKYIVKENINNH